MPSPGLMAQGVIDRAQPALALIKNIAKTARMRAGEDIDRTGFLGKRFHAGNHALVVAVGYGTNDDWKGTVYARFVFKDKNGARHAMITVAKDVVTQRWLLDFSIWFGDKIVTNPDEIPATQEIQDAIQIANDLLIAWGITGDIGEPRAMLLIKKLADFIVSRPASGQETVAAPTA